MPVAANVAGKELIIKELRVKYLVLDGTGYSIVDRSNQIVDSGEYLVDDAASPQTMDIVGREGRMPGAPCSRSISWKPTVSRCAMTSTGKSGRRICSRVRINCC